MNPGINAIKSMNQTAEKVRRHASEPEISGLKARHITAWAGASRRANAQDKPPGAPERCNREITCLGLRREAVSATPLLGASELAA